MQLIVALPNQDTARAQNGSMYDNEPDECLFHLRFGVVEAEGG